MLNIIQEMLSYPFLVRALIVGILVSLCASLLGVSLVLKRYSMIGDGLSHVGFGALALATALGMAPLAVSIPIVVLAAFLLLRISENSKIKGDAAIAMISTGSLSIGVIIIAMTTGMNTDVCNYLFGSILAMSHFDVQLSIVLSAVVLVMFVLFYNKIFAVTFDETFARATGIKANLYNMMIAFLTAVTIVLGMRMMGAMLISSFIIFPALTAMRLCKSFKGVIVCAAAVSLFCFFVGVVMSYVFATPTGASVVIVNIILFLIFSGLDILRRKGGGLRGVSVAAMLCMLVFAGGCKQEQVGSTLETAGGSLSAQQEKTNDAEADKIEEIIQGEIAQAESQSPAGEMGEVIASADAVENHADVSQMREEAARGNVVEIKEKMFIAQSNDIYLNPSDYVGKTIKYEGMFQEQVSWEDESLKYYYVIRYGPGCCGFDGTAGFEVIWDQAYPELNDWVEAVGVLEQFEENGAQYLRLRLESLTVLEERGAETVYQ